MAIKLLPNTASSGGGGAPSGAAGGDLGGTYPNPTVVGGDADTASVAASVTTAGLRTVADGTNAVSIQGAVQSGGTGTAGKISVPDVKSNSGPAHLNILGPSGVGGASAQRGLINIAGGHVTGTSTNPAEGSLNLLAGTTDKSGATVFVAGGDTDALFANAGRIVLSSGDKLGSTSTSGAAPATSTTSGDTLELTINGEAPQTIILATSPDGVSVAADIQAKARALVAADPLNQRTYDTLTCDFGSVYTLTGLGDSENAVLSSIVVSGGTATAALKLGIADGGAEVSGGYGTVSVKIGSGNGSLSQVSAVSVDENKVTLSGKLGVGTDTPQEALHVSGNGLVSNDAAAQNASLTVSQTFAGGYRASVRLLNSHTGGSNYELIATNSDDGDFGGGKLVFKDNSSGAADLVLDSSGNATLIGNVVLATAGKGLSVKEGADAKMGLATLSSGAVVVTTSAVTANSRIFLTSNADGGANPVGAVRVSTRTAGTSFTITSSVGTDGSDVAWMIVEPS